VFVICKTENALCETGLPTLTEMREINTKIVATRILTNSDHPIRHFFMDHKIQEEYAMKTSTTQPIFMKAIEAFGKQEIDVRKVETTPAYTRPPWLVNENETIDLTMCAIPKGASRERIQAEFTSLMVDKYGEHVRIYKDGSLMDDKVGFAIVTENRTINKNNETSILHIQHRTTSDYNGIRKHNTN
jgi:hypothetical protein